MGRVTPTVAFTLVKFERNSASAVSKQLTSDNSEDQWENLKENKAIQNALCFMEMGHHRSRDGNLELVLNTSRIVKLPF